MKFTKPYILLLTLVTISCTLYSQKTIPSYDTVLPELMENANAIVRVDQKTYNIIEVDEMSISYKRVVTVLNKKGDSNVNAYAHYDDDEKITMIYATIYKTGEKAKHISKKKFIDVSSISGGTLASDSRVKYLDYTPTSYPYTVIFEYQKTTNTTGFISDWFPLNDFFVSIEKSSITIHNPKNINLRTMEQNFEGFNIKKSKESTSIKYELNNQQAYRKEYYSPYIDNLFPNVKFALDQFSLKGEIATAKNWKEFGIWEYNSLIKNKNNLTNATKEKIINLTKHTNDTLEKAKIIYDYVQNKTRYISVQLGIGGFSPAFSGDVDKLGYGDCKGLTNYTMSLLDVVGIKSYYTLVYGNRSIQNIEKDFNSLQGNHAFLNIPYKGEDIWLECTSQTTPFGYLANFTDDRDVLVVTPEGGIIKHTSSYKNENNLQNTISNVNIDDQGNIHSNLTIETTGTQYYYHYPIENYDKKETIKHYKSDYWDEINNLEINQFDFNNDRESIRFTETIDLDINNYATFTGDNLLLSVNIFNKFTRLPRKQKSRKLPIEIQRGFIDVDTNIIMIPDNYYISNLPNKKIIESEFGTYEVSFKKINDHKFEYHRKLFIKAGLFPKESYLKYRSFMKSITKYDNKRVAFSKTRTIQ